MIVLFVSFNMLNSSEVISDHKLQFKHRNDPLQEYIQFIVSLNEPPSLFYLFLSAVH